MLEPSALLPMHSELYVLIKIEYTLLSFQFIHSFIYSVTLQTSVIPVAQ